MRYICLCIIVCLFLPQVASAKYLQSETFTLPTDGRPVETSLPLDPAHQYHVTVTSQYNLRAFLVACSHYDDVTRAFFGLIEEHDRYTLCRPPLFFNGKQLPTSRWKDDELGSYYLQTTERDFYIPSLDFYFWGTGAPLTLHTSTDLSGAVRTASVKIVDFTWEEKQKLEQYREEQRREAEQQEALRREQEAAALAEAERRQKQKQERIEREHQRRLAEVQAKQRLASRIRTSVIAAAVLLSVAFFWWMMATSGSRHEARLMRERRERQAREAAAAEAARARAEQEAAERRAEAERRRQKQAQRERQQKEAAAARRSEAEKAEAERQKEAAQLEAVRYTRFRTLQARYGDALFAWRTDEAAITRYAREHRQVLLDPKREWEIIDDYTAFSNNDLDFVEWMRMNHRELYHRIDEVFYYRVRAIAESLATEETPRRPTLSSEERQAKFERYRQRALERDRVQAEDRRAAVRQKLGLLQQFRDDLESYDLDEDDRERLIKEFEDDLFTPAEEHTDGTFKKL